MDWFEQYDELNYVLTEALDRQDSVKVAVLDTGILPDSQYAKAIWKYKDFVSGSQIYTDNTGHGTDAVRLLFKMCDSAAVCVARVWEFNELSENENVNEVIERVAQVRKVLNVVVAV